MFIIQKMSLVKTRQNHMDGFIILVEIQHGNFTQKQRMKNYDQYIIKDYKY